MTITPKSFYRVRFNHCDPMGHLNNSAYIDYFINGREDHLKYEYDIDLADFARKGLAWVVGEHEIKYLRSANYNDQVCIHSTLIDLSPHHLIVEMVMYDEKEEQIKAIMWSSFIPVNTETGRRHEHSQEFMDFAKQVLNHTIDHKQGMKARIAQLKSQRTE